MAQDVIEALSPWQKEKGFVSIKEDWWKWGNRNDLFDYVVTKTVDFIAGFIKQVEDAKVRTLAALFTRDLISLMRC